MYVENSYLSKQLCFYFMFPLKKSSKIYRLPKRVWSYIHRLYVLMAIEDDEKLNIKN